MKVSFEILTAIALSAVADVCSAWTPFSVNIAGSLASQKVSDTAAPDTPVIAPKNDGTAGNDVDGVDQLAFEDGEMSAFDILTGNIAMCLVASDLKRDSGFDGSSTGWTSWVDDASAFRLQKCLDKIELRWPESVGGHDILTGKPNSEEVTASWQDFDDSLGWLRWFKTCPAPAVIEYSEVLRERIGRILTQADLDRVGQSSDEFLSRIGCRIYVLPSGESMNNNLRTFAGAMVYGIMLFGGATRYRVISSTSRGLPRRAGERSLISAKDTANDAWLQYGGPERNYNAIDIGPCAFMEITVHPKGYRLPLLNATNEDEIVITNPKWNPDNMFHFLDESKSASSVTSAQQSDLDDTTRTAEQSVNDDTGTSYISSVESSFSSTVGGLREQVQAIVRRVLDGRIISIKGVETNHTQQMKEVMELSEFGLQPIRGMLLYGPPGCGKTLLAREISSLLTDRPPKIIAAPELLDRWVGGSEKLVRDMFHEAEQEYAACNGDLTKCGLHVIVIDEIDAVFRRRSSSSDSAQVARASAVNQILVKLDGVRELPNVLLIGTTNRRELLDDALLRPGRLEIQLHVPLPDRDGRREIMQIHFGPLRRSGRLSKPLCEAIDGTTGLSEEDGNDGTSGSKRLRAIGFVKRLLGRSDESKVRDLAADRWTKGFSGADIAGLVRCAGSLALSRARRDGGGVENLLITLQDVMEGLEEMKQ